MCVNILLFVAQPENLLYASNDPDSPDYNTIKVADFGLAKFVTESSMMKTTCGTVRTRAPLRFVVCPSNVKALVVLKS